MRQVKRAVSKGAVSIGVLATVLFVCSFAAIGQPAGVVARAGSVSGTALVLTNSSMPVSVLKTGSVLNPGDRIDTRGGGRVVVDLSDGSMVVVEPGSVVVLKAFSLANSLRELFDITLGLVRVKINHFGGRPNPYRMTSPTASIAVRGTEFTVAVSRRGVTQVMVYEGVVEVSSLSDPKHSVLIEAGRGVVVRAHADPLLVAAALAPRSGGTTATQAIAAAIPVVGSYADLDDNVPMAVAGAYDRYLASLTDVRAIPFLFRFNAFPEPYLDASENPAYATAFKTGEGRLLVMPELAGIQRPRASQTPFRQGGSLGANYTVSQDLSLFTPIGGTPYVVGGAVSGSRIGETGLASHPDDETFLINTTGHSTSSFYSGSIAVARSSGPNSFGLEFGTLHGTGSLSSQATDADEKSTETSASTSKISETNFTAGFSRDFSNFKLGVAYRGAIIRANDYDQSHTFNGLPTWLNSTRSSGYSSEILLRIRGALSPRLFFGIGSTWRNIALRDSLTPTLTVDSHDRDRAQSESLAAGLGYAAWRVALLTLDLTGGASRATNSRTEAGNGNPLQSGLDNIRLFSIHAALQTYLGRRLFASVSVLGTVQSQRSNVTLNPYQSGQATLVQDPFLPLSPTPYRIADRLAEFGAGWRCSPNFFLQYLFSTSYGVNPSSHSVLLYYTFRRHKQ